MTETALCPVAQKVVNRARQEDLNKPVVYKCAFVRNREGKVVMDRKFNTEELLRCGCGEGTTWQMRTNCISIVHFFMQLETFLSLVP